MDLVPKGHYSTESYPPPPLFLIWNMFSFCSHIYSSDPSKEVVLVEETLLETVQILKNDCFSTPTPTPPRAINDGLTDLQRMCDGNVKRKSDTPDWETLFPDTPELLINDTLNDSEVDRCFLPVSSDSKRRSCGGKKPVSNSKESSADVSQS